MKIRPLLVAGVLVGAAGMTALTAQPRVEATTAAVAESFSTDPVHSSVVFRVGHLGVAVFWGRFNEVSGTFSHDAASPGASSFSFTVKTASVDTGNQQRDRHLQSADFFNAREYPEITFKSTRVTPAATNKLEVTGDLTLHGVTKPITAQIEILGAGETAQGYKSGFEATFTIKRSDFGMTKYLENNAVGDEVRIIVAIEGKRG